jgi:hypothetical protein
MFWIRSCMVRDRDKIRFGKGSIGPSAQKRNPGLIEHGNAEGCVSKGSHGWILPLYLEFMGTSASLAFKTIR